MKQPRDGQGVKTAAALMKEYGFEKVPRENFLALMEGSLLPDPRVLSNYDWYVHRGDCRLPGSFFNVSQLQGVSIIVLGNLVVDGVVHDREVPGIIVSGTITADSILLSHGPAEFRRGASFRTALGVSAVDDYVVITKPQGPLVYNDADPVVLSDVSKKDVKVFIDLSGQKQFGSIEKLVRDEFIDREEPVYLEDEDREHFSLEWDDMERAILKGKPVLKLD